MPQQLRKRWDDFDLDTRLRVVDCPDRQIIRALQALVAKARNEHPHTNVTVLLPRRTYAPVLGRLLHDRTADKISRAVSRIPDAAATIVPYDVQSRIREAFPDILEERIAAKVREARGPDLAGREPDRGRLRAPGAAGDGDPGGQRDSRASRHRRRPSQPSRGHLKRSKDVPLDRARRRQRGDPRDVPTRAGRRHPAGPSAAGHRKSEPERQSPGSRCSTRPTRSIERPQES